MLFEACRRYSVLILGNFDHIKKIDFEPECQKLFLLQLRKYYPDPTVLWARLITISPLFSVSIIRPV